MAGKICRSEIDLSGYSSDRQRKQSSAIAAREASLGQVSYDTGTQIIKCTWLDRVILLCLVTIGIECALYYSGWWFGGGHRKNIYLFVILSYAIFRGVFRSVVTWVFFLFVSLPPKKKASIDYAVDILTTAMPGEPYAMFEKTLTAIANLRYPHRAFLLDGGNDPALKRLCETLGIEHIDCRGIEGAKAGKVNYCLKNYAKGEIVLVLDPDHIPQPDFLDRVVPQFEDPQIGFVQVVQAYHNVNNNFISYAAAEQTFGFYGPLMMGLNGLGLPVAIGANCTFRRIALDSIGGHAQSLAEDVNTSLRLHAHGWKSAYLPYRASYGLVPDDLGTFFKQQLKWSTGMFKLFFGEYFSLFPKFNWIGRLYYFFTGTYYLNGLVTLLTLLLPIIFLFLKVFAVEMPFTEFLVHLLPYVFVSTITSMYIQRWYSDNGEKGFPWRSMVLEKGTWYIYFLGLFYALTGKKVPYLPTSKDTAPQKAYIGLVIPHIVVIALSLSAITFALTTYHRIDGGTVLMIFFASVNSITLLPIVYIGIKPLFSEVPVVPIDSMQPADVSLSGEIGGAEAMQPVPVHVDSDRELFEKGAAQ